MNEYSSLPNVTGVPEDASDDFTPDDYKAPDYDETEPLEGDTHDHENEV